MPRVCARKTATLPAFPAPPTRPHSHETTAVPYVLLLMFFLAAFWLLLSGYWDNGLLLAAGSASVLLVTAISLLLGRPGADLANPGLLWRLTAYLPWLLREIIKANLDVVQRVWWPRRHPISPTLRRLPLTQRSPVGRVIYAQSITLTPGTVAIEVSDTDVLVHGLTAAAVEDLAGGAMDRRVTRLEQGAPR